MYSCFPLGGPERFFDTPGRLSFLPGVFSGVPESLWAALERNSGTTGRPVRGGPTVCSPRAGGQDDGS